LFATEEPNDGMTGNSGRSQFVYGPNVNIRSAVE
jgi:hypothetical protein